MQSCLTAIWKRKFSLKKNWWQSEVNCYRVSRRKWTKGYSMKRKLDSDSSMAQKALRLYQKLLLDGKRHYQGDLADYLHCSRQTVMRLIAEIEGVVGSALLTGFEGRQRWYQIRSISRNRLGLELEELRFLSICRDLAEPYLPEEVKKRIDESIFNFSMLLADQEYAEREKAQKEQIGYCAKGRIDYTPFLEILDKLALAMAEKRICIISYKSPTKEIREHRLAVNRIVAMNNALYVLGASVADNMEEITKLTYLAVHRIREIALTDRTWHFAIPDVDLSLFGLPWHEPMLFRIKFKSRRAAQYVRERIWSKRQKILELPDGGIILDMVSRSEPEVMAWVRGFGGEAELLAVENVDMQAETN